MKLSRIHEIIKEETQKVYNEINGVQEMAKIKDDLKTAIEKVINDNPDLEGLELKKAIKADAAVEDALMGDTLYDNQLNKFIALTRGEREVGQRGRKASPDGVKKKAKAKDDEGGTTASKLNKSITTKKGDDVTKKDVATAIGTDYDVEGEKESALQKQEKRKMVQNFLDDMKKRGIVGDNNKVIDKEKYDEEWATTKAEIEAAVSNLS